MAGAMRPRTRTWVPVCAFLFVPLLGCGGSGDGASGAAGDGGSGGPGGVGGSAPSAEGLWTGSGETGPGAPWQICFNLNEDGTALTQADQRVHDCQSVSLRISFQECDGSLAYAPDIPVSDGAFRLVDPRGYFDISGTFDGLTASGEGAILVDGELCSGDWEATPLD